MTKNGQRVERRKIGREEQGKRERGRESPRVWAGLVVEIPLTSRRRGRSAASPIRPDE